MRRTEKVFAEKRKEAKEVEEATEVEKILASAIKVAVVVSRTFREIGKKVLTNFAEICVSILVSLCRGSSSADFITEVGSPKRTS